MVAKSDHWRHHAFEGVLNFRDFGGYEGVRALARGRLYRSAHHHRATNLDLESIHALDLAVVVDLRTDEERREQPSRRHPAFAATVIEATGDQERAPHELAASDAALTVDDVRRHMVEAYRELPYRPGIVDAYLRAFAALAEVPGPMLIHCAAGKDRTGVLAALIHHVAGVSDADVMDDYLLTNRVKIPEERLERFSRWLAERYGGAPEEAAVRLALGVEPAMLEAAWASMLERSGGVDGYLREVLGVTAERRAAVEAALHV